MTPLLEVSCLLLVVINVIYIADTCTKGVSPGTAGTTFDVAQIGNTATDPSCGFWFATNVEDVKWCARYLHKYGLARCRVPRYGSSALFCSRNDAWIHGIGVNPNAPGAIESSCNDVALAVDWLVDNCSRTGWSNGPQQNMIVSGKFYTEFSSC
jgi:hypothetical protein